MTDANDELRSELAAILAAGKDLPDDMHEHLVDAFVTRLEKMYPTRREPSQLKMLYREVVPVGIPAIAAIAVTQGLTLLFFGHLLLEGVMALSPSDAAYMPAWLMLGFLWIAEVLMILAIISVVATQKKRQVRRAARRRPAGL